jgi:hypothetical protein
MNDPEDNEQTQQETHVIETIDEKEMEKEVNKKGHHRRASSFMKTGFASLAQTEEDEHELKNFFEASKQYIILTSAGKPVFSL